MLDTEKIISLLDDHAFGDFKWIDPHEIVFSQWVRLKCQFGCDSYGRLAACPPNTPSVEECMRFFSEYTHAIVLHFQKIAPDKVERKKWSTAINRRLIKLEADVFMAGYPKAFLLFMATCGMCAECVPNQAECKLPKVARPTAEGMAVDVYTTVRILGYPIQVLTDPNQTMNRYAFLLID